MKKRMYLVLIVLFASFASVMAQVKVSGTITGPDGNAIPGATIVQKGTVNGALSDFDGKYSLSVSSKDVVLQISFVGMRMVEEAVNGRTVINVKMEADNVGLDEVVVTALGIKRDKKTLT